MDWFEEGICKRRGMLKSFAMKLYRNTEDADDAVQATMLRALANRDRFEQGTNLGGWLMSILKNDAKSKWKRKDHATVYTGDSFYADHVVAAGDPERNLIVAQALSTLSAVKNRGFAEATLMHGMGHAYAEVAKKQSIPINTVKTRVCRGRNALAELSGWGMQEAYA